MKTADVRDLRQAMLAAADAIIAAEPLLTRIDAAIGDGDHGAGMKRGFSAMKREIAEQHFSSPYDLFYACGVCLVKSMGGASGVLFGTLLIGGLQEIAGLETFDGRALRAWLKGGVAAVMKRGKAQAGDKTMVDALLAAEAQMARLPEDAGAGAVMRAAADGALEGAQRTREMLPRLGRSKNFRDQALGTQDPGALSVSILFGGMAAVLEV